MYRLVALVLLLCMPACADDHLPFEISPIATFNEPWAMTFLPDGRMLITEKRGNLYVVSQDGSISSSVKNVPDVDYRSQGGLGDVVLHPDFKTNQLVYLSYAESGKGNTRGAAVARAKLEFNKRKQGVLKNVEVVWRQNPKVTGGGHYGHRIAFDKDNYMFISSGERQKFDPAQHMTGNLGKIVRLHDDGSVPEDNPFATIQHAINQGQVLIAQSGSFHETDRAQSFLLCRHTAQQALADCTNYHGGLVCPNRLLFRHGY